MKLKAQKYFFNNFQIIFLIQLFFSFMQVTLQANIIFGKIFYAEKARKAFPVLGFDFLTHFTFLRLLNINKIHSDLYTVDIL